MKEAARKGRLNVSLFAATPATFSPNRKDDHYDEHHKDHDDRKFDQCEQEAEHDDELSEQCYDQKNGGDDATETKCFHKHIAFLL
jgi:hypothetical protein